MSKWGKVDFKQLEEFQKKLQKLDKMQNEFCEAAAKELAARLLAKVIRRTPVGQAPKVAKKTMKVEGKSGKKKSFLTAEGARYEQYWSGYVGGTLRRGWTGGAKVDGAAYAQSLPIKRVGNDYVIDIINHTEYASYVEYGHRQTPGRYVPALGKSLKAGWVQGRFMLTISVDELQSAAPKILEKKLAKWLGDNLE